MRLLLLGLAACLAACQPQEAGQQVGQSLYRASVSTGDAIARVGDKTGQVLQNAGNSLRGGPPNPEPVAPPAFYAPPGYSGQPDYAAPTTPSQPQMGY